MKQHILLTATSPNPVDDLPCLSQTSEHTQFYIRNSFHKMYIHALKLSDTLTGIAKTKNKIQKVSVSIEVDTGHRK